MMIRPLDEVIQELENKYSKEELKFNLDARKIVCAHYDAMMGFIEVAMKDYSFVIKNVLLFNLSISMVSHLTYNLILQLSFFLDNVEDYKYVLKYYLLNERFDENDEILRKYEEDKKEIDIILQKLKDNCVYDLDTYKNDDAFDKEYLKNRLGSQKKPKFRLEKSISYLNGSDLIPCLENLLMRVKDELYTIKNGSSYEEMGFFEKIYELNYLYYAQNVWPSKMCQFRTHVANDLLRGEVSIDRLDREYRSLSKDFCTNEMGRIWENFSADKRKMGYELKRNSIDENQWDYFFSNIFKLEEINRWIEEIKNPPEPDGDKEKRNALLTSNSIFNINKMKAKGIDILCLYRFIGKYFINDNMKVYQWYALRRFLEKLDILDNCSNVDFKEQMNNREWFSNAPRKCSDNEMNNFNFLNERHPSMWTTTDIPAGSRASKTGLRTIYRVFSNLELNENELKR